MRILRIDRKNKMIRLTPEDKEDLWILSLVILPGDVIEAEITRRVKREDERGSGKVFRIRAKMDVEEVEFTGSSTRVKGRILEAPEEIVGRGRYQGLEIREGTQISLFKREWDESMVEELKKAEKESNREPVLIVSITDEGATMGTFQRRIDGIRRIFRKGEHSLREVFGDVVREILSSPEQIVIVGGPKIIVDEFRRFVEEMGVEKKMYFVVSPIEGEKGLRDIVSKRAAHIVGDERRQVVEEYIEEFLAHLGKGDGLASLKPEEDVEAGNVEVLLVHEDWIGGHRKEAWRMMGEARRTGAKVLIVSRDVEGEAIVRKLGGKVGIRRYRV